MRGRLTFDVFEIVLPVLLLLHRSGGSNSRGMQIDCDWAVRPQPPSPSSAIELLHSSMSAARPFLSSTYLIARIGSRFTRSPPPPLASRQTFGCFPDLSLGHSSVGARSTPLRISAFLSVDVMACALPFWSSKRGLGSGGHPRRSYRSLFLVLMLFHKALAAATLLVRPVLSLNVWVFPPTKQGNLPADYFHHAGISCPVPGTMVPAVLGPKFLSCRDPALDRSTLRQLLLLGLPW